MTATLKTTQLASFRGDVIVTEGAAYDSQGTLYGVFGSEEDARSPDADRLAWGIVSRAALTDEQAADAAANSEALGEPCEEIAPGVYESADGTTFVAGDGRNA